MCLNVCPCQAVSHRSDIKSGSERNQEAHVSGTLETSGITNQGTSKLDSPKNTEHLQLSQAGKKGFFLVGRLHPQFDKSAEDPDPKFTV